MTYNGRMGFPSVYKLGFAATRKKFKEHIDGKIVGAMGEYAKAEIGEANGYNVYIKHWRDEVDRLINKEMPVIVAMTETKTPFDRRIAAQEVIEEYNSMEKWGRLLTLARKIIATQYLKNPHADLKLPDIEISHDGFWLMVNTAIDLALDP